MGPITHQAVQTIGLKNRALALYDKLSAQPDVLLDRRHPKISTHCLYLYFYTDVYFYELLCIAAMKPLYVLLVRDIKHTRNSLINKLF